MRHSLLLAASAAAMMAVAAHAQEQQPAEPADEAQVRERVEQVLSRGWGDSPEGSRTTWALVGSGPSSVRGQEQAHALRLVRS